MDMTGSDHHHCPLRRSLFTETQCLLQQFRLLRRLLHHSAKRTIAIVEDKYVELHCLAKTSGKKRFHYKCYNDPFMTYYCSNNGIHKTHKKIHRKEICDDKL